MIITNRAARRRARFAARVAALGSAVMLGVTAWSWLVPASAATNAGDATVIKPRTDSTKPVEPLASGGSSTDFTLQLTQSAACTGDSTNGGYRVQSYMVSSAIDPGSLKFDASGPTPQATAKDAFREPLFDNTSNPYVNAQTAAATTTGGPGPIINIPTFNFKVYAPGDIPAGSYNAGIACTKGTKDDANQLDKYWNVKMTFTTASSDSPAQVTWTAQNPSGGGTTTTTGPGTTSTTAAGSGGTTTTTRPGSTTTTTAGSGSTTSTTTGSGGTTTTTTASSQPTATLLDSSGNPISANATLTPGQQVTISATGFTAGETAAIAANSDPIAVGTAVADSTGKVTKAVTIPTGLAAGPHTLTVTGAAKTATFPFTIAGANSSSGGSTSGISGGGSSGALPRTGSSALSMLLWAALLFAFGRIAILLGRPLVTIIREEDR
ncbi:MAG: hypothetical protein JOZ37_09380 [Actinobacteria bacterium]|nr:hypothetical protein [Actinomycetota bacterium]